MRQDTVGMVAAVLLAPPETEVASNSLEPGLNCISVAQLMCVLPGSQQRFLRQVLGSIGVAGPIHAPAYQLATL